MRLHGVGLVLLLGLSLTACRSSGRYYWGDYEDSVYSLTANAGAVDANAEIERLNELLQRATERGKLIPPGVHAHLGMLYSVAGDSANARAAFEAEKALYPESTVFIDGVLARAQQAN